MEGTCARDSRSLNGRPHLGRGQRLGDWCGVPAERLAERLDGLFDDPGLHPGLVCAAPLGRWRAFPCSEVPGSPDPPSLCLRVFVPSR